MLGRLPPCAAKPLIPTLSQTDRCITRERLPGRPLTPTLSPRRGIKTSADLTSLTLRPVALLQEREQVRGNHWCCPHDRCSYGHRERKRALREAPLRLSLTQSHGWLPGRSSPQPSPRGDLCITRGQVPGRPLTLTLSPRRRTKTRLHIRARGAFCKGLQREREKERPRLCGRGASYKGLHREREQEPSQLRGGWALCKGLCGEREMMARPS